MSRPLRVWRSAGSAVMELLILRRMFIPCCVSCFMGLCSFFSVLNHISRVCMPSCDSSFILTSFERTYLNRDVHNMRVQENHSLLLPQKCGTSIAPARNLRRKLCLFCRIFAVVPFRRIKIFRRAARQP